MNPVAEVTAPFSGTSRLHTSEPRWPTQRPELDPTGTRHVLVTGEGIAAAQTVCAWQDAASAAGVMVVPVAAYAVGTGLVEHLTRLLDDAPAGTRMLAAGDEVLLARATAAALAGGLRPPDLRVQLTDPAGPRPVQCVHCRAITETAAAVDEITSCAGCGVPLLVFPHFSRRIGAYLGFHAEAEELA